jgi:hypothetical protein
MTGMEWKIFSCCHEKFIKILMYQGSYLGYLKKYKSNLQEHERERNCNFMHINNSTVITKYVFNQ